MVPLRSSAATGCAILLVVLVAAAPRARAAPAPLALGLNDPVAFQGDLGPADLALELDRARQGGASLIRLGVSWRLVDTSAPADRAQARDPDWAGYRWDPVDSEVRAVTAAGMQPLLVAGSAPDWFEGPSRPPASQAPPGAWRPSAEAFGDFAHALAARYDGTHRDAAGALLPRVRYLQAWNEPNLSEFLDPQSQAPGRTPVSPTLYRGLLNAFAREAKAVRADDVVLSAGLGPFGDYPPFRLGGRTPPVAFARSLLCVSASGSRARRCPHLSFDAFATHAFPGEDPRRDPVNAEDLRLRVGKVTSALRLAARAGTISARQAGRVWMTELSWDGGPGGPSYASQARFLQLGLYMLWREGVDAVLWYNLRDRAEAMFTQLSGLFARGATVAADQPKPAYAAFRFPFVAVRSNGAVRAWGRAPASAPPVVVEQDDGRGGWRRLARFDVGSGRVFLHAIRPAGHRPLRARQGSDASLPSAVTTATP